MTDLSTTTTSTNTVSTENQASTESSSSSSSDSSSNITSTTTKEVPIVNYEEALAWGMRQLGKQRRKSGHQIELKVIGHMDYRVGEWIRVYMPTYNEDCFMFISKCSVEASADEEFITSLTLVDYPPSLGAGKMESESDSSDDNSSTSTDSTSTTTGTDTTSTTTGTDTTSTTTTTST